MAINLPNSSADVKTRVRNDVQSKLPLSNPFLKDSWLGALIDGFSERVYDFFTSILSAIPEIFPDTTTLYIDRWAGFYGLAKLAGSVSTGKMQFRSSGTAAIPAGTILFDSNGFEYITTNSVATSLTVVYLPFNSTIARVGTLVTITLAGSHSLLTGNTVNVTAVNSNYNITGGVITVISELAFTYISGTSGTDSTTLNSLTAAHGAQSIAMPSVESIDADEDAQLLFAATVTIQSPIVNVDDTVFVASFNGIIGSVLPETDEELRARTLDVIRNPVAHFNVSDIKGVAKSISQVTRAFIQEATPADGQVRVYIMTDNEAVAIPNATKITEVKNKLLLIKPANVSDTDLIVLAPTEQIEAFTFSAMSPNTTSMQKAVTANLKQFFATKSDVGINVVEDAYRAAIFQTVDLETGQSLSSFALSAPSADIVVASTNIATLGAVTYPS